MKTLLAAIIFSFAVVFSASAQMHKSQSKNHHHQKHSTQQKDEQQPDPRERAKIQTEMMSRNYDLTPTQLRRVTEENRSFYTKMYNVRNRYSNDRDYEMHRENTIKDHDRIMKGILSKEQYNDYIHNRSSYYKDLEIGSNNENNSAPQKDDQ